MLWQLTIWFFGTEYFLGYRTKDRHTELDPCQGHFKKEGCYGLTPRGGSSPLVRTA